MAAPNFNGQYTGQTYTSTDGSRYIWINDQWRAAGFDYTAPTARPRQVSIQFATFMEDSRTPVEVRVMVNGAPWNDAETFNGRAIVHFYEQQIINPTRITFENNNSTATKSFIIQTKTDQPNEVTITEYDENGVFTPPFIDSRIIEEPVPALIREGGGGGGGVITGAGSVSGRQNLR
jgi:hypothetical protein